MKIDIFCHILPRAFYDRMLSISTRRQAMQKRVREVPVLVDLDLRFKIMDAFEPYVQVFSLATPALDSPWRGSSSPATSIAIRT